MHENCVSREEFDRVVAELRASQEKIAKLEALLERFIGPHAPPSTREARYPKREPTGNPVGKPKGSNGATRKLGQPDQRIRVRRENCRKCGSRLGDPTGVEKHVKVDLPPPQKPIITEFELEKYFVSV